MSIYEHQTFKINSLSDAKLIIKNFSGKKINLIHRYESVVFQGPDFVKTINKRLRRSNVNYIVELNDNIGLILAMISLEIKLLAISGKIKKEILKKLLSMAKNKNIEILYTEQLNKGYKNRFENINFYIISPPQINLNFTSNNLEKVSDIIPISFFQFRPKHKLLKDRLKFVEKYYDDVSIVCKKKNIKLIINDDFEIAEKLSFDGIHLGQNDKSCLEAKKKFGQDFIVGVSCSNSIKLCENAKMQNADYVALGPMFKTLSKKKKEIDLSKLPFLINKLRLPFTLIGGINHYNFKKLLKFKPSSLAMINSFWNYKTGPKNSALLFQKKIKEINNNEN